MRSLISMLTGEKSSSLSETLTKRPYKERTWLRDSIQEITVKDVRFLESMLDALNDGSRYHQVFEEYFGLKRSDMVGGSLPYQILAAKALAFILALKEGREPVEE